MPRALLLVKNLTPGVPGPPKRLNIETDMSIFVQNIIIWHPRPPKNYGFNVLAKQNKFCFFIVEL